MYFCGEQREPEGVAQQADEEPVMTAEEYFLSFDDDASGNLDKEELRKAVQTFLDAPEPEPEFRSKGSDSGSDVEEDKYMRKFDRPETPDPRLVVSKIMPMTALPVVVTSQELAQGPSPGAHLLRSARRLFCEWRTTYI